MSDILGKIGVKALVVIVGALVFRMLGVSVWPSWNKSQEDRTIICHDGLYTKSNSSGRNRWNPSCDGICMRRYRSYRGCFSDCADSSAGRICYRFLV